MGAREKGMLDAASDSALRTCPLLPASSAQAVILRLKAIAPNDAFRFDEFPQSSETIDASVGGAPKPERWIDRRERFAGAFM